MKTFQVVSLILLASSAHARILQDTNDTITTDGNIDILVTTVAPTEETVTEAKPETADAEPETTEVAPTDAAVTTTNATDGGFLSGVGDWVGNAADTVSGTVVNATGGISDWISNAVNPNEAEESGDADNAEKVEGDGTPDSAVANLMSASVLAISAAAVVAFF